MKNSIFAFILISLFLSPLVQLFALTTPNSDVLAIESFSKYANTYNYSETISAHFVANSFLGNDLYTYDEKDELSDGVKLVLIGVVYEKGTTSPVSGTTVQLEDTKSKIKRLFRTTSDGTFYFKLEVDKQYQLYAINSRNGVEDTKIINTTNKKEPQILRAMLEVSREVSSKPVAPLIVEQKPMEVVKSPQTASAVVANPSVNTNLIFKVQLGAFKELLPNKSPFLLKVKEKVNVENAANGYVRYMAGEFNSLKEANEYMQVMKNKGYDKVFVVPYYKGERKKETPEKAAEMYK
ncbi:MAG: hypothetical protein IPN94_13020 [Sphingobacteriales bacterium]|nr:hypothetical protein [Sphingobacteriales bacterium]